jgi:acyl-CoA thioesterase I
MVENLRKEGIYLDLVANPSVTGWTTKDLIEKELPVFDTSNADFVTILIGVNDWVQEYSKSTFEKNLKFVLDHVINGLETSDKILLINIPDFSVTPDGPKYSKGRDITQGLVEFNQIIQKIGKERSIPVCDLFKVSYEMKVSADLVAEDNLHPSAKTYKRWEEVIRPFVIDLLK